MESRDSSESRRLSPLVLAALAVVVIGVLVAVLLVVEFATGSREGAELLASPRPLLPAAVEGFDVRDDPGGAALFRDLARRSGVPVTRSEAVEIGAGESRARLSAAAVASSANPRSKAFRAQVLVGAAAGYGIEGPQYGTLIREEIVVYTLILDEGRLSVWFFRDAFVQLFVPEAMSDRADAVFDAVIRTQARSAAG